MTTDPALLGWKPTARGVDTMTPTMVNRLVAGARLTALGHQCAGLTDGALLEAFLQTRDEVAFAALVRRHGPMPPKSSAGRTAPSHRGWHGAGRCSPAGWRSTVWWCRPAPSPRR